MVTFTETYNSKYGSIKVINYSIEKNDVGRFGQPVRFKKNYAEFMLNGEHICNGPAALSWLMGHDHLKLSRQKQVIEIIEMCIE